MKIIYGTLGSGKSKMALELISNPKRKSYISPNESEFLLYLSLDNDMGINNDLSKLHLASSYKHISNCFMIDIEMEVANSKVKKLVIDSINFIRLTKTLNTDFNFRSIISDLVYLESTYNLEIIVTYNILERIDVMEKEIISFLSGIECELIKVNSRKKYKTTSKAQLELSQFP